MFVKTLSMTVTFVHVFVKPEFVQRFIQASRANHELSIREKGNFRFDILQDAQDPTKFVLYEAYASEQGSRSQEHTSLFVVARYRCSVDGQAKRGFKAYFTVSRKALR